MQLEFEITQIIAQGSNSAVIHNTDNTVSIIYKDNFGALQGLKTETSLGEWNNRIFTPLGKISGELNAKYLRSKAIPGFKSVFVWYSDGLHRIALDPDTSSINTVDDPYRLFYGIDSEKLYMNIAQRWEMVATLKHSLMSDLEKDDHPQYMNEKRHSASAAHQTIQNEINALSQAVAEIKAQLDIL